MDGQLDLLSSLIMYANWFEADDSPEKNSAQSVKILQSYKLFQFFLGTIRPTDQRTQ